MVSYLLGYHQVNLIIGGIGHSKVCYAELAFVKVKTVGCSIGIYCIEIIC